METNEEREEERVSLCQCALVAFQQLNLASRLPLIQELLMREKAVTLSQVNAGIFRGLTRRGIPEESWIKETRR